MHLNAKKPIFVPKQFWEEMERMSKAALMDLAWDFAKMCTPAQDDGSEGTNDEIMGVLRARASTVLIYRSR